MNRADELINTLRSRGCRITKVRQALIDILNKEKLPLSQSGIIKHLNKLGINVDRTTIYRELLFLTTEEIVQEVKFAGEGSRYELSGEHHHHLVCLSCKNIADVTFRKHLDVQEKYIKKKEKFLVTAHSLEFYGLCKNCVKQA